jgi:nitrite reductase/ring-hydroxylating ferredoxin subunit
MRQGIHVCAVEELVPGTRHVVEINEYEEALVLNLDGTIYAISNICPHQGAALQRGQIERTVLYCPLHRWGFELTTGVYVDDVNICTRIYTVEKRGKHLYVCLP